MVRNGFVIGKDQNDLALINKHIAESSGGIGLINRP